MAYVMTWVFHGEWRKWGGVPWVEALSGVRQAISSQVFNQSQGRKLRFLSSLLSRVSGLLPWIADHARPCARENRGAKWSLPVLSSPK